MDDRESRSNENPPAARSAEVLRKLRERTQNALAEQRARMGELETRLTDQLNAIASAIASQVTTSDESGRGDLVSRVVLERLQAELESTRANWNAEREAWEAERARLTATEGEHSQALDERHRELESRQQALDERAAELNHRDRELRQRQELLDSYAAQCEAQQSQLNEAEGKLQREREELAASEANLRSNQKLVEHQQNELAERQQACERDEAAVAAERAALQAEREAFDAQQSESATAAQSASDELMSQMATSEENFAAERATWEQERESVAEQRRLLAEERDELRQKFDLAVEDVQRLRGRVSELEQELASRPAADQNESVELVHVRAERDALEQRVAELERQVSAPADDDSGQETAELQRRFELAVEDVRDLKKENSRLEQELAEARSRTAVGGGSDSGAEGGTSSWELMKRQMLANLEDEVEHGEYIDESREKERATIENTIQITDEVIANKDREIAELKNQLAEGGRKSEEAEDDKVSELVDADEIIRQHRERIAKLEEEMQEKLRAAELELSVERAKITREQTQLADLRAELESQRAQGNYGGGAASPGQPPKRRWLSKLGLTGEEERPNDG